MSGNQCQVFMMAQWNAIKCNISCVHVCVFFTLVGHVRSMCSMQLFTPPVVIIASAPAKFLARLQEVTY